MMGPVLLAATTTTIQNPAAEAINSLSNLDQACGVQKSWACQWVYDWTGSDSWAGVADWVLAKPLAIALIIVVAIIVSRVIRWLIGRSMRRLSQPGRRTKHLEKLRERTPDVLLSGEEWNLRTEARVHTITAVFRSLATAFVWFVATVWILDVIGVNFGPLIAGAGIVGVALGFGTQTMVKDFIAGFFLVVEDQYGVGDTVDLGGEAKGTVEAITLRSTRLRDVEGNVWWVPNGQLTRVANKSHEWARALIDVVVPYQADLDAVSALMKSVADDLTAEERWAREVLEVADVWGVQELGSDGIVVRMVIKTRPGSQFGLLRELRKRLKAAFDVAGIAFAYAGGPTEVVLRDEVPPGSAPGRRPDDEGPDAAPASGGGDAGDSSD
jgi:moderate conductance mechanosensitive channel